MKRMPYVCEAKDVPGRWAGDWLLVTDDGTTAHRTRDGAYSALAQCAPDDNMRDVVAANIREAIEEHYAGDTDAEVTMAANTSGCPLIRLDLGHGYVFNLTVTRARS